MLKNLKKLKFSFSQKQNKSILILSIFLFFAMGLEILGLGALLPVISFVLNPNSVHESQIFNFLGSYIENLNSDFIVYLMLLLIVLIFSFKTIFLVFLTSKQNIFLTKLKADLSSRLFSKYIYQSYSFHLKNNSSRLLKIIQVDVGHVNIFLTQLITVIIESGLILSAVVTLIYIEPIGAISVGVFFIIVSTFFFQSTKKRLVLWGEKMINLNENLSKNIIEGLNGIKAFKILGKEQKINNQFKKNNFSLAKISSNHLTTTQLPRFFLELISIIGLTGFIISMLIQDKQTNLIVSILSVFVAATFRMIPSINRVIASLQNFKYYEASLDIVYDEFKKLNFDSKTDHPNQERMMINKVLKIKDLCFEYSKNNIILKNISFDISKGETVGIVGESGSGKSSLVDIIIGLLKPNSGSINVDGVNINSKLRSWQNNIGYVSQSIFLTDDSIIRNVALGVDDDQIDIKSVNNSLESAQLKKFIETLPDGVYTKVGERGVQLSGGQRQRIGIARALYNSPEFLVFDEATSALDSETESLFMDSIYALKGKTIIIIAHRLSTLNSCDRIYKIENNNIFLINK